MKPTPSMLDAALAHHRAGRLEAALLAYRGLRARAPRDPQVAYLGGVALLQMGRAAESVSWLEAATGLAPRNGGGWMCLGVALGRVAKAAEAERALKKAVELEPGNGEAWTNLGLALERSGRGAEAL